MTGDIDWLRQHHPDWCDLNSVGVVQSIRQVGEAKSVERRFYISSREPDASYFAKAVHQHWGIENQLHWLLDVIFDEDQCRVRTGYAPENFSRLRRMALNMLKQETSKLSLKAKRRKAGWDFGFSCKKYSKTIDFNASALSKKHRILLPVKALWYKARRWRSIKLLSLSTANFFNLTTHRYSQPFSGCLVSFYEEAKFS